MKEVMKPFKFPKLGATIKQHMNQKFGGNTQFKTLDHMNGENNPAKFVKPVNDTFKETSAENNLRKFGNVMRFLKSK
jgi:hypothetical protein